MTLVEISEREVIEAAKAWFDARNVACSKDHNLETRETFLVKQESLYRAVSLLVERERVEQSLDTGTVPQPESLAITRVYPPMVEGQCHWETGDSMMNVAAAPDCPHIADSSTIKEEGESGNEPQGACIHGTAAGIACASCESLGGRAVDCPIKCPYCQGACKRGFEGHEKHRCAVNSAHVWGAEPIPRPTKKLSQRAKAIEARRLADVSGRAAGRDDIDYGSDDLPSAR